MEGSTFQVEYIHGPLDGAVGTLIKLPDQIWVQSPNEEHVRQDIYPVYSKMDGDGDVTKYRFVGWSHGQGGEPTHGKPLRS